MHGAGGHFVVACWVELIFIVLLLRHSQLEPKVALLSLLRETIFKRYQIIHWSLQLLLAGNAVKTSERIPILFVVVSLHCFFKSNFWDFLHFHNRCLFLILDFSGLHLWIHLPPSEWIHLLLPINIFLLEILVLDIPDDILDWGIDVRLAELLGSYTVRVVSFSWCYQYSFRTELPTCMFYSHSRFQVSSLVDFTRVTEGPIARWPPEQLRHTNTPKSREAPMLSETYSKATFHYSPHIVNSLFS